MPATHAFDAKRRQDAIRRMQEIERARASGSAPAASPPKKLDTSNVDRNDPCPCGSGKKFKKCHGSAV